MSDDQRFEAIYRKRYARIWRYFRSRRVSDDESHDLTQDTFKRFFEHMKMLRGEDELPYLLAIAKSVLLNWLRKAKAGKRFGEMVEIDDPEEMLTLPAPPEVDYADRDEETRRRTRLLQAINELSEGERQCLRLWLQGLKYTEIAKLLDTTVDAVKSRIRDAKSHLRTRFGEKR